MDIFYSVVIPVYNRPKDLVVLLESFCNQKTPPNYEIIIVDDGSSNPLDTVAEAFNNRLPIRYFYKKNTGPGDSRNFGVLKSKGVYVIFVDSDCILPENYLAEVNILLCENKYDCLGGCDASKSDFTMLQKSVNQVMTSFITTGGIRGKKVAVGKFQPRSFNMILKKGIFQEVGGFRNIHPGEDPDLIFRIWKKGYTSHYIENAFVYHKRRITLQSYSKQMYKFGMARSVLNIWHPHTKSLVYWFPLFFIVGFLGAFFLLTYSKVFMLFYGIYFLMLFFESLFKTRNILVAMTSVILVFVGFSSYAYGFVKGSIKLLGNSPEKALPTLFFNIK